MRERERERERESGGGDEFGWMFLTKEESRHSFDQKLYKSQVGDLSRGRPEVSLFNNRGVGEGATPFSGLLHFTLDPYLIILSVKQGGIK